MKKSLASLVLLLGIGGSLLIAGCSGDAEDDSMVAPSKSGEPGKFKVGQDNIKEEKPGASTE